MAKDDALNTMGHYMHQDIGIGANTLADFARNVLAPMGTADRAALRTYLANALPRLSPSELKGNLNRATKTWGFSSKGADQFLRAVFALLEAES